MKIIKKLGIYTSGGDSPGMNACIRAAVLRCIKLNVVPVGIYHGYEGLINADFKDLHIEDVKNIGHLGGTVLKTARSKRFLEKKWRQIAFDNCKKAGIDALFVIGGDGSFTGAKVFSDEFGMPVVGAPGTIDNDLYGTDFTIGYDTAINTVVQAIDKIRDTAESHDRVFFIEVMGRDAGLIALRSAIAGGVEGVLIPETTKDFPQMMEKLKNYLNHGKGSFICVVAEGDQSGGAYRVAEKVKKEYPGLETRVTVLGHIQRGGSPTAMDRIVAVRSGIAAIDALLEGKSNIMIGIVDQKIQYVPFEKAIKHHITLKKDLLDAIQLISVY